MHIKLKNVYGCLAMALCCMCMAACSSEKEDEPELEPPIVETPEHIHLTVEQAQNAGYYPIIHEDDQEGMTAPILDTNIVDVDLRNNTEFALDLLGSAEIKYGDIFSTSKKWAVMTPNTIISVCEPDPITEHTYYWVFRPHKMEIDNLTVNMPVHNKIFISRTSQVNNNLVEAELSRDIGLIGLSGDDDSYIPFLAPPVHMLIYQTDEGKRLADERIATGWSY